jgi:vitamin B12 transporter
VVFLGTGLAPVSGYWAEGLAEYGSNDSLRGYAVAKTTQAKVDMVARAGWMSSEGIDSFDGRGDRDGFENRTAALKAIYRPLDGVEIGAVGHWIEGESEFDGLDPATFRRADTLDRTRNRIGAVRGWAKADRGGWILTLDGSFLASSNRNALGDIPLNRTAGRRFTTGAQLTRETGGHEVTLAAEHQGEDFRARDQSFFGATDQDRSRDLSAGVFEWRAKWRKWLSTDIALRHDRFSAFRDATTLRAMVTVNPTERWRILAGYGEGIAQPTFYDLYGFFPGSFTGNPALRPERSQEWQASARWSRGRGLAFGLGAFEARLRDEIVDVFDPATFRSTTANALGVSRRRGIEAEADIRIAKAAKLSFYYTWLDAEERQTAGALAVREVRRPRHSARLSGHGESGNFVWGASLAYVGKRGDTDFDSFPARAVVLDDYVIASFRLSWEVIHGLDAYVRAENAFDARYQDVVGYRTAGRTIYAGLRFDFDDYRVNRPRRRR